MGSKKIFANCKCCSGKGSKLLITGEMLSGLCFYIVFFGVQFHINAESTLPSNLSGYQNEGALNWARGSSSTLPVIKGSGVRFMDCAERLTMDHAAF